MRSLFSSLFLIFSLAALCQEETIDSAWIVTHYTKREVMIPMRDGIKLFTAIYLPRDSSEKHPILITRTPYSCNPYGENKFRDFWTNHNREYFREGYIFVYQDVRGRYMSEGEFVDVRPFLKNKTRRGDIDESSDTYDTIDWLLAHVPGNNGKVGIFGISYPGFYAAMGAASKHPALKASSPQAPVTNWFIGDDFHHNGALFLMDAFSFYSGFGRPRPKPTTQGKPGYQPFTRDLYDFYLRTGAVRNFSRLLGDSIAFWKDITSHPDYDSWWQARDARQAMRDIPGSVMVVGGLFDAEDCWGGFNLFRALRKQSPATRSYMVQGPWFHGGWSRGPGYRLGHVLFGDSTSYAYAREIELPYFNYFLKGQGDISNWPRVRVFFTGENQWRSFPDWPPFEVKPKAYFFQPGGGLDNTAPKSGAESSRYLSDPAKPIPFTDGIFDNRSREYMTDDQRFAARRPDVLVFQTAPLEEDVRVSGPVLASLLVSLSTTDADFIVKLIDVYPDDYTQKDEDPYVMNGYQMLVRGEVMRGRYRNSLEKPEAFVPGKITPVRFELPDVAHTFRKGHRIMVHVQSTWFPLVDRNPQQFVNIYTCGDEDFVPSEIRVYHSLEHPSKIILPILK